MKISLISIVANTYAIEVDENNLLKLTNTSINENRKVFEDNISNTIYEATKNLNTNSIKNGNFELEGFILYGLKVKEAENYFITTDLLVSLHDYNSRSDENPYTYNIVRAAYHEEPTAKFEKISQKLSTLTKSNILTEGYFLLNDELKNSIAENDQSEYRSDFSLSTLRKEALRAALNNPGIYFDKVKFAKENQLTDNKIKENLEKILNESKKATKLKKDTDELHFSILAEFIKDRHELGIINNNIDEFIQNAIIPIYPGVVMSDQDIVNKIGDIANAIKNVHDNQGKDLFIKARNEFRSYIKGDISQNKLKALCKVKFYYDIIRKKYSNLETVVMEKIQELMNDIQSSIVNKNNEHGGNKNLTYDQNKLKKGIDELKVYINGLTSVPGLSGFEERKKGIMLAFINNYEEEIIDFDFSNEIGNEIYLNTLYFDVTDEPTKENLLYLSSQNKISTNILQHDLEFPKNIDQTPQMINVSELMKQEYTIFRTKLYNSQIEEKIANIIDMGTSDAKGKIITFFDSFTESIFSERLKGIFIGQHPYPDIMLSNNKINALTPIDYMTVYSLIHTLVNKDTMIKLTKNTYLHDEVI